MNISDPPSPQVRFRVGGGGQRGVIMPPPPVNERIVVCVQMYMYWFMPWSSLVPASKMRSPGWMEASYPQPLMWHFLVVLLPQEAKNTPTTWTCQTMARQLSAVEGKVGLGLWAKAQSHILTEWSSDVVSRHCRLPGNYHSL